MKPQIAIALSVIGVVGASSAAALVNAQILDGGPASSGASAAVLPPTSLVEVTIPEITTPTSETLLANTSTSVLEIDLAPPTTGPVASMVTSDHLTVFNVGNAGSVAVDVVEGHLKLVSAEPKPGWTLADAEEDGLKNKVEAEFRSSTVRIEFEASLVDGKIVPQVNSSQIGAQGATPVTSVTTVTTLATVTTVTSVPSATTTSSVHPNDDDDGVDDDDDNSGHGSDDDDGVDDDNSGHGSGDDEPDDD